MGGALSDEGCSICGVRGKVGPLTPRSQPVPMRLAMPRTPRQLSSRLYGAEPQQSFTPRPLIDSARRPCGSPLPPSDDAYRPWIDSQPIGSPVPGYGDSFTPCGSPPLPSESDLGSMRSYNEHLEAVRKGLIHAVKTQQRFHERSSTAPRIAQVGFNDSNCATSIGLNNSSLSQRDSLGRESTEEVNISASAGLGESPGTAAHVLGAHVPCRPEAEDERERALAKLSQGELLDLRYEEMNVSARLKDFSSSVRKPPKIYYLGGSSGQQLRSKIDSVATNKVVRNYQDAMKERLSRIADRDNEFQNTLDPATAVKEGVTRFYETCGKAGTMDPQQIAENPDVDYVLSPEERDLIEEKVVHLSDRATI